MNIKSAQLGKATKVNVLLPTDVSDARQPYKTMWLLHGLSGDASDWMRYTSIERYAKAYGLAVIMPDAERSWYTNTAYGMNFFSYITEELPALCRKTFGCLSDNREDNIVAGLSMGGYGALKAALTYPERYGACISLSGSLDITRKSRPYRLEEWQSIFGFNIQSALELEGGEHDLFALAERNKKSGKPFPELYMWCGNEDSLLGVNRDFDELLSRLEVPHVFTSSEGDHTWRFWDMHIQSALKWKFGK